MQNYFEIAKSASIRTRTSPQKFYSSLFLSPIFRNKATIYQGVYFAAWNCFAICILIGTEMGNDIRLSGLTRICSVSQQLTNRRTSCAISNKASCTSRNMSEKTAATHRRQLCRVWLKIRAALCLGIIHGKLSILNFAGRARVRPCVVVYALEFHTLRKRKK